MRRVFIRRQTQGDAADVARVHTAAFTRIAAPAPIVEVLIVEQLQMSGDSISALSLVAEIDGAVVGHVMASRAHIDDRPSVGLGPLGVVPDRHRQGVGSALMHAVVAAADALKMPEIVLLGDPDYYGRFGFQQAEPLGVIAPNPLWGRHFQIRPLSSWTNTRRGRFRYAPAFDEAV